MVTGILLILIALGLQFYINRAKFNRRNAAGVEEFKSYGDAVGKGSLEKIGLAVAAIIGTIGLLLIVFSF